MTRPVDMGEGSKDMSVRADNDESRDTTGASDPPGRDTQPAAAGDEGSLAPAHAVSCTPAQMAAIEQNETGRVEAFSDGVFAIAATLLVFNLHVPDVLRVHSSGDLWRLLLDRWPVYGAFVVSFLSILIMWSSHHNIFGLIRKVDHSFLLLNGLVLLGVAATPFTTSLLGQHLGHPGESAAATIYSAVALFIALAYNAMWHYAARGGRLLASTTTKAQARAVTRQYAVGPIAFALALLLSPVSAAASVLVFVAAEVFFSLPIGPNRTVAETIEG